MAQLNASFYRFAPLGDLPRLRLRLRADLGTLDLKGTVNLAPEGVNGSLAGPPATVRSALERLRRTTGLDTLAVRESVSETSSFKKLCFKIRPELVPLGRKLPRQDASRRLPPEELREWFGSGKPFRLLDARNEYEVRLGTFAGARSLDLHSFAEFAEKCASLPAEWKAEPLVTFCTGGIRCEKAAPFLAGQGFAQVYQLEGGILGYFEKNGGAFWSGECFVFDGRVGLDPQLRATGATLCASCQGPIPAASRACPHCGR